jgi:hypothetical protein
MPVSSQHPAFAARVPDWQKCRHAFEGQSAIKAAGTVYLPRLTEQSDEDYNAYKTRALFYSITSKTISALVGMATSKAPAVKNPPDLDSYFIDDSGVQFHELLASALSETLLMGRFGVLVDRPEDGGRPTMATYTAEGIINWRVDSQGNPTLVVLQETTMEQSDTDEFELEEETQYRVLRLADGVYTQDLYDDEGEYVKSVTPLNMGVPMDFIPFYIVNPFGLGFDMHKPPVLDIVDINISHYRTSADLEHGRHYTGLPVPVVSGVDGSTRLRIGSATAWVLPDPSAKAYYLEFTGQGLVSLETALSEKQSQLASLSARLIGQSSNGSEAADTVRLRYMSETASLAAVVRAVEALVNRVYRGLAMMESLDPTTISIKLDKEFLDSRMSSTDLRELVKAYIEGGVSKETLVFNLRRGDVLPPDRTDLEEVAAIDAAKKAAELAKKPVVSNAPKPEPVKPQPGVKS